MSEGNIKDEDLFSKQKHNNGDIIDKRFLLDFVETLCKRFIHSEDFLQLQHFILDTNCLLVLEDFIAKLPHLAELIKVDDFEPVMKNPHNLLFWKASKAKTDVDDFE